MSMASLERAILAELQEVEKNPRLRKKHILEWSTGEVKPQEGEKLVFLPELRINVAIKVANGPR